MHPVEPDKPRRAVAIVRCSSANQCWLILVGTQAINGHATPVSACPIKANWYLVSAVKSLESGGKELRKQSKPPERKREYFLAVLLVSNTKIKLWNYIRIHIHNYNVACYLFQLRIRQFEDHSLVHVFQLRMLLVGSMVPLIRTTGLVSDPSCRQIDYNIWLQSEFIR